MEHSIALVTGTTSGLGYAAASMLATKGYRQVIVTGRSLARVQETAAQLAAETKTRVFTPLELDLDAPTSVQSALAKLVRLGLPIDFLLLNAGMVPGNERVLTAAGVEAAQAPLIGHHQLTVGLLRANLLSPNARIVISGAEPARGGVPMFSYTDVPAFAAKYHQGDRTAAVEALIRNGPNVRYVPNNAYADAKLIVAWWSRRWRAGYPPAWPCTLSRPVRRPPPRWCETLARVEDLFMQIVNLVPGMNQTPETAARRYLQASEFGTDVSGQFFASAQGKFSGPNEAQRQPHLHDRASQEAAWKAVVNSLVSVSPPQHLESGVL